MIDRSIPANRWADPLFLTNRAVDLVFIIDLSLQLVLMFPSTDAASGTADLGGAVAPWVDDPYLIARHYVLSRWFILDFFSIAVSAFDIFSPEDSGASRFRSLRAVRVLRLLKLLRLLRGSRIFKRWEMVGVVQALNVANAS